MPARKTKQKRNQNGTQPKVPATAVPQLFNEQQLVWYKAHFDALKAVHEVLEEIRDLLKE